MSARRTPQRTAKNRADALFSQIVRARGRCARCGSTQSLQCAHIIPRRYSWVRTDERNAWCLCSGCHRFLDDHAFEKVAFTFATIGGQTYGQLRDLSLCRQKFDWVAERARLQLLVKEAS